ncbi:MAG: oligosaccharide flippase family protein [Muribaculum sp.]|nr:oligosaccharide flippase family protein [Muribaculum sp.]
MIVNGIIMVPLYFEYISLPVYGAWLGSGNVVSMLGLLEAGFASVITQKMSVAKSLSQTTDLRKLAGANISSAIIISTLIFLIGLLLSPFIAKWVNTPDDYIPQITIAYIIALISASISILVSLFGAFPQVWQDTKTVGIISVISNILAIASLIVYLLCGFGIISIPLSYLTRSIVNLALQGLWIIRHWKFNMDGKPIYNYGVLLDVLRNCILPFLSRIAGTVMYHSQSFIISAFINPSISAIYDLTSKITQCIASFLNNINGSFFALFSLTIGKGDKLETAKVFNNVSKFFILTLTSVMLFSLLFTKSIMNYWVGLQKFGGMILLILIVSSSYVNQSKSYFNNLLYCGGLINKSAKYDIYCMVVYLIMLLGLIHFVDVYAIPAALMLSTLIFLIYYIRLLKSKLGIDINSFKSFLFKDLLLSLLFTLAGIAINIQSNNIPLIIAICSVIYMIFLFCVIRKEEELKKLVLNKLWKKRKF